MFSRWDESQFPVNRLFDTLTDPVLISAWRRVGVSLYYREEKCHGEASSAAGMERHRTPLLQMSPAL